MNPQEKTPENSLEIKKIQAIRRLRECSDVVVALSGGVDSAVLLALAAEALGGERVLAVTGISGSLPSGELEEARAIATSLGVAHETVVTREMERAGYRANTGDRCFHCRSELFGVLQRLARERGFSHVAYGAIAEDASDYRPGMRAAEELNVLAPLLEAGIGKAEVRALAAEAGLDVREKPASACLASRIPIGTEVTGERLTEIDRAEAELRRLGFRQLRVRHHGEVARLELDDEGFRRLRDPEVRARVVEAIREAGFRYVALDLEGYRSGSMNPDDTVLHRIGPARDSGQ
jgi:uncharacterized protein